MVLIYYKTYFIGEKFQTKEADDSYRLNISSDQHQTKEADEVYRLILQSEVPKTECANIVLNLVVCRDSNLSDANGTRTEKHVRQFLFNGHKASSTTSGSSSKDALTNCVRE